MSDSEMIERVAKAIAADRAEPWDDLNDGERRSWLETGRAAIEAMKAGLLETVTTYDTPIYDDIGMQEMGVQGGGDWMKVDDIVAALTDHKTG